MWESSTGKVLESFGGHTNIITHCVISESGDLLVTCSDDTTCKVLYIFSISQYTSAYWI